MIGDLIERAVRRPLPQSSRSQAAAPTRLLGAASPQAARARGSGTPGHVAARDLARDQKKARQCRGVVAFGDEASFWLDGTLHQTWARVGCQPRVDTFGMRKTAHVFGIVTLEERPRFLLPVRARLQRRTFLDVPQGGRPSQSSPQDLPDHRQRPVPQPRRGGQALARERIATASSCSALPPYSPEFNPIEGVWKVTKKLTTHNRFYRTTDERDAALRSTFGTFQARPSLIANHVARFL